MARKPIRKSKTELAHLDHVLDRIKEADLLKKLTNADMKEIVMHLAKSLESKEKYFIDKLLTPENFEAFGRGLAQGMKKDV